jgi:tetratricopeptide (TPR) repeat protein
MSAVTDRLLRARQARREKRLGDARQDLIEAVKICRDGGSKSELAEALTGLGQIERDLQHTDAALELYGEAAVIYRTEGDLLALAHTVRHLGDIHRNEGHGELADVCYREALRIYRSHERTPPLDLANAIRGFALLKENHGETTEARSLWAEARELYAAANVHSGVAESSRRLANLQEPHPLE